MTDAAPHRPEKASALIEAYFAKRSNLVLFLAARTGSHAAAEDLVQDLYLKVAALDPDLETASPNALLYRMAINLAHDSVRRQRRSEARDTAWRQDERTEVAGEEVADEPSAERVVISRERLSQLIAAIAELPPQRQKAFRLYKLEGMSQAEAARVMGISVKAIEGHISAALKALVIKVAP